MRRPRRCPHFLEKNAPSSLVCEVPDLNQAAPFRPWQLGNQVGYAGAQPHRGPADGVDGDGEGFCGILGGWGPRGRVGVRFATPMSNSRNVEILLHLLASVWHSCGDVTARWCSYLVSDDLFHLPSFLPAGLSSLFGGQEVAM